MIRRPPRSTRVRSSAASDVYKRQEEDGPLSDDPYGSVPPDKLLPLLGAPDWTVNLGWPGPANPMIGEAFNTFVLSNMMALAARGDMTPEESVCLLYTSD